MPRPWAPGKPQLQPRPVPPVRGPQRQVFVGGVEIPRIWGPGNEQARKMGVPGPALENSIKMMVAPGASPLGTWEATTLLRAPSERLLHATPSAGRNASRKEATKIAQGESPGKKPQTTRRPGGAARHKTNLNHPITPCTLFPLQNAQSDPGWGDHCPLVHLFTCPPVHLSPKNRGRSFRPGHRSLLSVPCSTRTPARQSDPSAPPSMPDTAHPESTPQTQSPRPSSSRPRSAQS